MPTSKRYEWTEGTQSRPDLVVCEDTQMDGYSGVVLRNATSGRWEGHTTGPKELHVCSMPTRAEAQRAVEEALEDLRAKAVEDVLSGKAQPKDGKPFEL